MRILFDLIKNHLVSIISTLLISSFFLVFLISFIVSDRVVKNFLSSDYFEQKLKTELIKYDIVFDRVNVLKVENFRNAEISINEISHVINKSAKARETSLNLDLFNLIFRAKYINDIIVNELIIQLPSQEKGLPSLNIEDLTKDINSSLKKIIKKTKKKSLSINKILVKAHNSKLFIENLVFGEYEDTQKLNAFLTFIDNKNKQLFTSGIELRTQDNFSNTFFSSSLKINEDAFLDVYQKNEEIMKMTRWLGKELRSSGTFSLNGSFDENRKKLKINAITENNQFSAKFTFHIDELIRKANISISDFEAAFNDEAISIKRFLYDQYTNKFVLDMKELKLNRYPGTLKAIRCEGVFDLKNDGNINFDIFWSLDQNTNKFGNVKILQFEKEAGDSFSINFKTADTIFMKSFDFLKSNVNNSNEFILDKIGAEISGVELDTILEFKNGKFSFSQIRVQADTFSLYKNDKLLAVMEKFLLEKGKEKGSIQVKKISQNRSASKQVYNLNIDFGEINSFQDETEITVSLVTSYKNFVEIFIEQFFNNKIKKPWFLKNLEKNEDRQLNLIYTNKSSLQSFENFLKFENGVYEIELDQFSLSSDEKNMINFKNIELIGFGENISFELTYNKSDEKVKGSLSNWINALRKKSFNNLSLFFSDFKVQSFAPEAKFIITKGPVNIKLSSLDRNGRNEFVGKVDLSSAEVIFPNLFINKKKNNFGDLSFRLSDQKNFEFIYKQKDVYLEGSVQHSNYSKINKVFFSTIQISNLIKASAEYIIFPNHKEFYLKKALVDLAYLKKFKVKKRKQPLDIIFSNVALKSKRKIMMENIKGEIRVYNGIRGYANSINSKNSEATLTFIPKKNNQTEILISSKNAGNFLRKTQFYENGNGGGIDINLLYKNKNHIEGKFKINDFRVRKAPVLAQLISAASIIGLVDNLNGVGLLFTQIEGNFSYKDKKLELSDGIAVGPSIGLTMSGYEKYNNGDNDVRVEGLISPIYIINGVIKSIPIIGKVFGGEKGEGVFGMAYKVEGKSKKPVVFVNPLSIITPGAFRNIFKLNN